LKRAELLKGLTTLREVLVESQEALKKRLQNVIDADQKADEYFKEWDRIKKERANGIGS